MDLIGADYVRRPDERLVGRHHLGISSLSGNLDCQPGELAGRLANSQRRNSSAQRVIDATPHHSSTRNPPGQERKRPAEMDITAGHQVKSNSLAPLLP
jgi:hypothetical protein